MVKKRERALVTALLSNDINWRDTLSQLIKLNTISATDFEWASKLRLYNED